MEKVSANKNQQAQSRSVADNLTQRKQGNNSAPAFVDNRAESETQLRMSKMINNSPYQAKQYRMGDVIRGVAQRQENKEEEELVEPVQRQENKTGLPDNLKSGMENLSGHSLDHVKVHYNSPKPAAVQAHAYAQGSDIHLASGQEKHLPHELGHVVQQAQGRVKATTSVGGVSVNDNPGLESEATGFGERALQMVGVGQKARPESGVLQLQVITPEDAEKAMQARGGGFRGIPYNIITPYGNDPEATNCHGYTINGAVDHWDSGQNVLANAGQKNIAVFIKDRQIAHSGRYNEEQLTHFLIGVGIVSSTLALDNTAGYVARYNLPVDRKVLDAYLDGIAEEDAAAEALAQEQEEALFVAIGQAETIIDHAEQTIRFYDEDVEGGVKVDEELMGDVSMSAFDECKDGTAKIAYVEANRVRINLIREDLNAKFETDYAEV